MTLQHAIALAQTLQRQYDAAYDAGIAPNRMMPLWIALQAAWDRVDTLS